MPNVVLHQPPALDFIPNSSPFCIKVEAFLRQFSIPYKTKPWNPQKAPRGKMPFAQIGDQLISDSENIIDALIREFSLDIDKHLTNEQHRLSHAIRRIYEDVLYYNFFANRWLDDANWNYANPKYFGKMPMPFRLFVPGLLRKGVKRTCHGHGITRYSAAEREEMASRDFAFIDHYMSDNEYFWGDKFSRLDATVIAFSLSNYFFGEPNPLKNKFREHKKFRNYAEHHMKKLFPECWKVHQK